jgi:hypothetical protein
MLNEITWSLGLQVVQGKLPYEAWVSMFAPNTDKAAICNSYSLKATCVPSLKSFSKDFEMLFQTHQFDDILPMDLHCRTPTKPHGLWFCDTP